MRLVLDWDGTCTVSDSLVDAIRRFGDPGVFHAGHGSYGESLAAEVGSMAVEEGRAIGAASSPPRVAQAHVCAGRSAKDARNFSRLALSARLLRRK